MYYPGSHNMIICTTCRIIQHNDERQGTMSSDCKSNYKPNCVGNRSIQGRVHRLAQTDLYSGIEKDVHWT
jgi:hypothetical protein